MLSSFFFFLFSVQLSALLFFFLSGDVRVCVREGCNLLKNSRSTALHFSEPFDGFFFFFGCFFFIDLALISTTVKQLLFSFDVFS